jgi:preprotein translocase subunit SecF
MRLHLVPHTTNIDFIKLRLVTFSIASLVAFLSIFGIFFKGLNYGIDFRGGYIFDVKMPKNQDITKLRKDLTQLNVGEVVLQNFGSDLDLLVKIERKEGEEKNQEKVMNLVKETLGKGVTYKRIETVGPKVGGDLIRNGMKAITFALIAMLTYIIIRFEWQFALCAAIALLHDCLAILALFCFFPLEFNETAIIAILITAGYSINDTIVIFDRIRENFRKYKKTDIKTLINKSINETLSRTTLTATTSLLALLALYFFGGKVISTFSIPIILGIIIGSFSSIFLASPLLVHLFSRKTTSANQEEVKVS